MSQRKPHEEHSTAMSNSQSHRPRGLISKLSSRNRRRRRESHQEKVPIPSFSIDPSQEKSDRTNNNCAGERPQKVDEVGVRDGTGKENTASQMNNILSGNNEGSKIINRRVTDLGETTNDVQIDKAPTAATIVDHRTLSEVNVNIDSTSDRNVASSHAKRTPVSIENTSKCSEINTIKDNKMSTGNSVNHTNLLSTTTNSIDGDNIMNCNNKNLASDNLHFLKDIAAKDNFSSRNTDVLIDDAKEKSIDKSIDNIDSSSCSNFNSAYDRREGVTNLRHDDCSRNSKKRKLEPDAASGANLTLPPPQLEVDTMKMEKNIGKSSKKQRVKCSASDLITSSARNAEDVSTHNHHDEAMGKTATSSEVEIIVVAPSSKAVKPKSICKNLTAAKSQTTSSKSVSKTTKKSSSKTIDKIPVPNKPREIIQLDSDSDSSSSSDQNWAFGRPPKKRSQSKKAVVKAEKKSKPKMKNTTLTDSKESSVHSKQKSTRSKTKSTSSDGKKLCYACSTCKCNSRDGTSATPSKQSVTLSGSHARQERALINRLQKIERNVQWMESQKHDVGRQLMKHRNVITKKWEESNPSNLTDRPKFLDDIDEKGGNEFNVELSPDEVGQASLLIFGETKAKTALKTTLTQHFGSTSKSHVSPAKSESSVLSQDASNIIIKSSHGLDLSPIQEDQEIEEEQLRRQRAAAHLTSMVDLAQAIAYSKGTHRISSWDAATTAPTLASKLDEILTSPCSKSSVATTRSDDGFDELLQLFAQTPSKLDANPASLRNDLDDAANQKDHSRSLSLTPRGKQVADSIEQSIMNDSTKLAVVERTCPEWRDNIRYAQLQTDPEQLGSALDGVKKAKSKVKQLRERILQALRDRESTLEMFEQSLERSIDRLKE